MATTFVAEFYGFYQQAKQNGAGNKSFTTLLLLLSTSFSYISDVYKIIVVMINLVK